MSLETTTTAVYFEKFQLKNSIGKVDKGAGRFPRIIAVAPGIGGCLENPRYGPGWVVQMREQRRRTSRVAFADYRQDWIGCTHLPMRYCCCDTCNSRKYVQLCVSCLRG